MLQAFGAPSSANVWLHGLLSFYGITMDEFEEQLVQLRQAQGADVGEPAGGEVRHQRIVPGIGSVP